MRLTHLGLATALANGILYCCALPLWEGFDEPVHYGYVESLSVEHNFPVLLKTNISKEIRESFDMTPLSRLLSQTLPGTMSFEQWARLSEADKQLRKSKLALIPAETRKTVSSFLNYEAQQAPLAYLIYAPLDALIAGLPLAARILVLRMGGTVVSCLLTYFALIQLLDLLQVKDGLRLSVITCVFASQMMWATVAHVGNDVLAVPLVVWFLTRLAVTVKKSSGRNVLILSSLFALGLVTKAYFLAFAPVFVVLLGWVTWRRNIRWTVIALAIAIVLAIAGPWYGRNLSLYGGLSGTQQSIAGIGWREALKALPQIDWLRSQQEFARWSLWTGNWSFLSFSQITLDIELWLLRVALLVYFAFWRRVQRPELWLWAACGCFGLSLIYQTCVTWVATQGESRFAEPWYAQGVIVCVWVLCFVGLSRWRAYGRWIAAALVLIFMWIAIMTYLAKLLPYYSSGVTRANLDGLWRWWNNHPTQKLASVTLAPASVVIVLLILFIGMVIALSALIIRRLFRDVDQGHSVVAG